MEKLDEDDLVRILTEPKNALVKQYKKLIALDGVDLDFSDNALREIARQAIARNTGARGLRSIIESTMKNVMYEIPSEPDIEKVIITKDTVDKKQRPRIIYKKTKKDA